MDVWSVCVRVVKCGFGKTDIDIIRNVKGTFRLTFLIILGKSLSRRSADSMKAEGGCGYECLRKE